MLYKPVDVANLTEKSLIRRTNMEGTVDKNRNEVDFILNR